MRPDQDPRSLGQAVALAYHDGAGAPRVIARGNGPIAGEIIRRAREAGVYVHESRELVGLLMQVDLDQQIPPKLYSAIAELLAWLYRLEQIAPPGTGGPQPTQRALLALPDLARQVQS